jgi:hypothetical protein
MAAVRSRGTVAIRVGLLLSALVVVLVIPATAVAPVSALIGNGVQLSDGTYLNAQNIANNPVYTPVTIQADNTVHIVDDVDSSLSLLGTPGYDLSPAVEMTSIAATPADFGQVAAGQTVTATPNPASVLVTTTSAGGYGLSVSRTAFAGGADIPLAVSVSAPAGATAAFVGSATIPSAGSLSVGSRASPSAVSGDEWGPVYSLGPVPFRPGGPVSATVTYTVVTP